LLYFSRIVDNTAFIYEAVCYAECADLLNHYICVLLN